MYNGVIISDSAPTHVTGYGWLKIAPDNSREWYHFDKDTQSWVLDKTEPAPALLEHTHLELGDINFTGSVSTGGEAGITGSKTLGGYRITFKNGLLTGFESV